LLFTHYAVPWFFDKIPMTLCNSWNASPINLPITYTDVLLAAWNYVMSCTYLYSSSASFAVSNLLMPFTYRYSTFVHVQWMVRIWKMTSKAVSFGSTVQFSTPFLLNYKLLWIFLIHLFYYVSKYNNMSRYIVKWMNQKSQSDL
jgi:hypothetical protein